MVQTMSYIKNLLYDYMEEMNITDYTEFTERECLKFKIKYLTDSISTTEPLVVEFYESIFPRKTDLTRWIMLKSKDGFISYGYNNLDDFICASNTFSKLPVDTYFSSALYDGWYKSKNAHYSNVLFLDIDGLDDINLNHMSSAEIADWLKETYSVTDAMLPNWAITSGHGLHLYYVIDELDYTNPEHTRLRDYYTKMLICFYKGDRICKNVNHILRLPFSFNCKHEPIQTKLHHLNDSKDTDISRLDFFYCSDDKLLAYDEECAAKRKSNTKSKSSAKPVNHNITKPASHIKQYTDDFIVAPDSLKYFDDFRRNARYTNIIKDLHNYYVRHKGQIGGRRNIFVHILASYCKMAHMPLEEVLDNIEVYCTSDFLEEAHDTVKKVYASEVIYHYQNDTIAELLDFNESDYTYSYCCYSDAARIQRKKQNNNRAKDKQFKYKREQSASFHKNLEEYIADHPDESSSDIATYFGLSIRTIQRLKKKLRESK